MIAELLVAMAALGTLTVVSAPTVMSYWRTATLNSGAQELRIILNQARALAIAKNTKVCVNQNANKVQFLLGGCGGAVWTEPGTNGNGWFTLQNRVNVTSNPQVVFNFAGYALTPGVYTVQNPVDNSTLSVTVAVSGRITTP